MKKFLAIYLGSSAGFEKWSAKDEAERKERQRAGMDAWMSWAGQAGSGMVDMGSPVGASARLSAAAQAGAANPQIGGYSILQAESKDAVVALLKNHPHFGAPGASIEVFEFLPLPGM